MNYVRSSVYSCRQNHVVKLNGILFLLSYNVIFLLIVVFPRVFVGIFIREVIYVLNIKIILHVIN